MSMFTSSLYIISDVKVLQRFVMLSNFRMSITLTCLWCYPVSNIQEFTVFYNVISFQIVKDSQLFLMVSVLVTVNASIIVAWFVLDPLDVITESLPPEV